VTARKKDGTLRVCTHLTAANKVIVVDKYPLPTMEEMTSHISAAIMPVPGDQRQLIRFLSTAWYYLRFNDRYAGLCSPLRRLLLADAEWKWTSECQRSFDEIKRRFVSPPVLAHFDSSADITVTCDASSLAIGACLSLRSQSDDVDRPEAFVSRVLSATEQRYSASE
jgi:RNase H-like domain found in reverse transcriptase